MATDADLGVKKLIQALASLPEQVQTDAHASGNMMAWRLSIEDVCEAICEWIEKGERVKPVVIKEQPKALVGMTAYELAPVPILSHKYYIRITIYQPEASKDKLLLLSVHSA